MATRVVRAGWTSFCRRSKANEVPKQNHHILTTNQFVFGFCVNFCFPLRCIARARASWGADGFPSI